MTLEQAIKTALEYENKVRDTYLDAASAATDGAATRVFKALGDEEQGHVDYLNSRLEEWKKTGRVTLEQLDTVVPSRSAIEEGVKRLHGHMTRPAIATELEMLSKALRLEIETGEFYRKMVSQLGEDGVLFARFLEIEEGHLAIVQAEIDYLNNTGYFFDFQEFKMEH